MARNKSSKLRLARSENTPIEILIELSKSDDILVLGSLIHNENLPINLFEEIFNRYPDNIFIWLCFARNKKAPSNILRQIAEKVINQHNSIM